MALSGSGVAITQEEIARQVFTPGREGTMPQDILTGARRHGALAVKVSSLRDLLAETAAGHPVIVFQNLGLSWFPRWHYAVVVGYDLSTGEIMLHSGVEQHKPVSLNTFEYTWRRADKWALSVTSPADLPVTASVEDILYAANALERVGEYEGAVKAYQAVTERWQHNRIAYFGLGNAYYSLGNFEASKAAFNRLLRLDPMNAPAWNNLAYSLAALNRYDEALNAARKAVDIDRNEKSYQQTLTEIERMTLP